jgi:hypothetical protein
MGASSLSFSGYKFTRLDLVHITPHPGFAGLNGTDQGVLRLVEMLRSMLVLRRIATSNVSTNEAHAQMNPRVSHFDAFLANVSPGCSELDLVEVATFFRHRSSERKYLLSVK